MKSYLLDITHPPTPPQKKKKKKKNQGTPFFNLPNYFLKVIMTIE